MGSRIEYICDKCGKEWVDDLQLFYLMGDDRLEQHGYVMMTYEIEKRSVAKGIINETYCKNCDKDIKLYLINSVKTEYPNINPNRIIEEYKYSENIIFGDYKEFKEGIEVSCKKCHNSMVLNHYQNFTEEFNLNCNMYSSYCDNCGEHYIFYAIKPHRRDYTKKEVFDKIKELIDEKSLLGFADEYESINEIDCPFCSKKIPKQNSFEKCPKCDSKLSETSYILYD